MGTVTIKTLDPAISLALLVAENKGDFLRRFESTSKVVSTPRDISATRCLSKSNPTLINGRPIKKSWYLSSGDVIQLSFEGPKIEFIVRTVVKEVKKPAPAPAPQPKIEKKAMSNEDKDELETIYQIVSFCFPIIGAVIWLVNMKSSPNKAKTACYAALFGIIAGFVLNVIAAAGAY